jgi:hypothetical protein
VTRARLLAGLAVLALAGCGGGGDKQDDKAIPKSVAAAPRPTGIEESEYGTPVKDRVATLGLLNKRNNLSQDLVMKTGESRRVGNVIVKLATCEKTLPWEQPKQTGAFVQVFVEERQTTSQPLAWRKVFSGWLFKESPSLNVVEHPVYDVWVKDCAMKFPGEEDTPAAASNSAPKPAGSASAAPSASATPAASPKPSVSPSAVPKAVAPSLDI